MSVKIPIKLYYNQDGTMYAKGNKNVVPFIFKLSSATYRLQLITPYSNSNYSFQAFFEKGNGETTTGYPMVYIGRETVIDTEINWYVYACDIENSVLSISDYNRTNQLKISFYMSNGDTQNLQTLNSQPFITACSYSVTGNQSAIEDTPLEQLQRAIDLGLSKRPLYSEVVLQVNNLPTIGTDSASDNYNVGYVYLALDDTTLNEIDYPRYHIYQANANGTYDDLLNLNISADLSGLDARVSALETKTTTLETDVDNVESGLNTANTNITNLDTKVNGVETNVTTLQNTTSALQNSVNSLQSGKLDKSFNADTTIQEVSTMQDNDMLVLNRENTAQKVKFSTIKEEIGGSTIVANPQLPENAPRLKSVEINGEVFNNETDLTEINTTINDIQADRIRSIDYTLETANWVDSGEETTPFKYTLNLVAPINVDNDTTFMNTANSDFSVKYGFYLSSVSYNTATPTNITCIFKSITQPTENISATIELIPQGAVGSIEQTITPNPNVTETSPTLSSLGIDGTNYKLLGSGGGSNVQANVTTTDTDPYLTSLQINNDKYRAKNYDNEIATLNQNVNKNTQDIENIITNGTIRRVEELPVNATCFFIIVDKYGVTQPTNYFNNKYWYVNPNPVATLSDLPTANADNKNKIYYVTAQSKAYCCYTADNTTYNWVVLDTILTNLGQTITYVAERPLIANRVASQGYFVYNNTDLPNVNDFYEVEVVTDSGTIENFSKTNDITILSSDEISYVNPPTFPFHIIGVKSLPTTPTAYNAVSGTTIAYIVEENNLGLGAYINGTMIYGQALLNTLGLSNVTYKGLVNETNFPSSLDAPTTQAQLYVYLMKDHFLFQFKDKDIGYSYVDNDGKIKKYVKSDNANVFFENGFLEQYIKEYKIPIKILHYSYLSRSLSFNGERVIKYKANINDYAKQVIYYITNDILLEPIFSTLTIEKATNENFTNNVLLCAFTTDKMLVNARNGVATTYNSYDTDGVFTQVDVNYDSNTLQVNGANALQVKTSTGIKSTANGIAVDLVAGDGISITDNTISVDLDNYDGGSF